MFPPSCPGQRPTETKPKMDINLYQPRADSELITFTIPHTLNSVTLFIYGYEHTTTATTSATKTKLVSGYEKNYRAVHMTMTVLKSSLKIDGYVISCVRLPYICTNLINSAHFRVPLLIAIVQMKSETQVWHIFAVKKHREPIPHKKIIGVTVNNNGHDIFYSKELIGVQGNVASAFVTALMRHTNNVTDVDISNFTHPHVKFCNDQIFLNIK
ncbi:EP23 [Buzura suppressaria nucleopolyhedrovirus]|uniref:EP23 n=1 Tax=Buzura suppressaria nuclear polyhedrosis virus TaxID=74320 RepID=W5VKA3_NPVBS|nr:EP23 [Buzura suppressaria nucleopolyhedrovirus]AHH82605.1 EP23 [Buzura suppressaria nucleopolyhedrovirus]AKN90985.1 EP23 [Buzura suppressaria nucleopolyhedrovirus]QYF10536.1 early 23 kda protein [Buzura suppressaria nucleopolyhedrovirus]